MSLDGPEIHAPHKPHRLTGWVEALLSISALVVSFASIAIALHHGQIMEKLVQANSLPYLTIGTSNATPDGQYRLSLDLQNDGVGPAREESLKLRVGDRPVKSLAELLEVVFGPQEAGPAGSALHLFSNQVRTRFIPGGRSRTVFQSLRTEANAAYWTKLDESRRTWSIEACYCSVFHECWDVREDQDPRPVKACARDEAREFTP